MALPLANVIFANFVAPLPFCLFLFAAAIVHKFRQAADPRLLNTMADRFVHLVGRYGAC